MRVGKVEEKAVVRKGGLPFFPVNKNYVSGLDVKVASDERTQYGPAGNKTGAVSFKDEPGSTCFLAV